MPATSTHVRTEIDIIAECGSSSGMGTGYGSGTTSPIARRMLRTTAS